MAKTSSMQCWWDRQMQERRAQSSQEGQRWKPRGELSGEPRWQVWSVAGPAKPLRQQEEKSRREGGTWQKEKRLGKWD